MKKSQTINAHAMTFGFNQGLQPQVGAGLVGNTMHGRGPGDVNTGGNAYKNLQTVGHPKREPNKYTNQYISPSGFQHASDSMAPGNPISTTTIPSNNKGPYAVQPKPASRNAQKRGQSTRYRSNQNGPAEGGPQARREYFNGQSANP